MLISKTRLKEPIPRVHIHGQAHQEELGQGKDKGKGKGKGRVAPTLLALVLRSHWPSKHLLMSLRHLYCVLESVFNGSQLLKTYNGMEDFTQDNCNKGEKSGSTLNTTRTSRGLLSRSRVNRPVGGKLLRRDIKNGDILAKLT